MKAKTLKGFTLIESMITVTIFGVVSVMAFSILTQAAQISLGVDANVQLNNAIRSFTSDLADEAREANDFILHDGFFNAESSIAGNFRQPASGFTYNDYIVNPDSAANFCVFIYYGDDPNPNDSVRAPIERMVGYYLAEAPSEAAVEIRKFEFDVSPANQNRAIPDLIPAESEHLNHEVVVGNINGLFNQTVSSGSVVGVDEDALFYNVQDRSIIVSGKITTNAKAREASGTYNFTISPRG